MPRRLLCLSWVVAACAGTPDPTPEDACAAAGDDALADCVTPTESPEYYVAQSLLYFDTMDKRVPYGNSPAYAEQVVRWEWPPWLLLTGFGRELIESADQLLRLYPSIVEERDCRFFDTNPFGRCRVVFYYDAHDGRGCPIYEEFTFDSEGEMTFIEAWSDLEGLRPVTDLDGDDPWGEQPGVDRLATRVPGLGGPTGDLEPGGEAMRAAAATDPDLADLDRRMADFLGTWTDALAASGDSLWEAGCGW